MTGGHWSDQIRPRRWAVWIPSRRAALTQLEGLSYGITYFLSRAEAQTWADRIGSGAETIDADQLLAFQHAIVDGGLS